MPNPLALKMFIIQGFQDCKERCDVGIALIVEVLTLPYYFNRIAIVEQTDLEYQMSMGGENTVS